MEQLFLKASLISSRAFTNTYSTSFSLGIKALDKSIHEAIYAIYGFVRVADEIVDTFHDQNKEKLIHEFQNDTFKAINDGFSTNAILHSFQWAVNHYGIDHNHITAFFDSMIMDLHKTSYNREEYEKYIYGSAEVVGLMCLKVFCHPNDEQYKALIPPARKLGSAFQKINFLRDLKADYFDKGRMYFPNLSIEEFNATTKKTIEAELEDEFAEAFKGIKKLPSNCKFGVYTAYTYYLELFKKIRKKDAELIKNERVRIPDRMKNWLLLRSILRYKLGLI
ncbi:MAG: phytoene synthase [Flavobacteriales bacterium]|nr:phytoene synthase [Flavobacteriales bacterium]|tara:strand:- start:2113 stop:2949 length:837 start_codon:yes stop_codon:yes gene_type:complete